MLFSKENGKHLLGVVNQSGASAVTALPWGSWRSTRKRPTERMFLIELYAVWEIVQYLTILGICRKLSKLKKKKPVKASFWPEATLDGTGKNHAGVLESLVFL